MTDRDLHLQYESFYSFCLFATCFFSLLTWGKQSSLTFATIAKSSPRAIDTQQKSLDFFAEVVLENIIALNYLLSEQGGVCAIANTSHCTWIKPCGTIVNTKNEQATWQRQS